MKNSRVTSFAAVGPDGTRIVVHPASPVDTVGELARSLDLVVDDSVMVDGRLVCVEQTLADASLRVGSQVGGAERPDDPSLPADIEIAVVAGPDCRSWAGLGIGRHFVGRARSADIRLEDDDVELHHGALDVAIGADGAADVTFTQLTGRGPVVIDGAPCDPGHPVHPGDMIRIGSSVLQWRARPIELDGVRGRGGGSVVASAADPWRFVVRRGPGVADVSAVNLLEVPVAPAPTRAPSVTGLVGAGVAVVGAGVMAAVLGQAMFALFAAIGAVASIATWSTGVIVAHRAGRRGRRAHRVAMAAFRSSLCIARRDAEHRHRAAHPMIVDMLAQLPDRDPDGAGRLWSRHTTETPLSVTVGRGTVRWDPPITECGRERLDAELLRAIGDRLDDLAVPLTLARGRVVALRGTRHRATSLCRSVLVQLAVAYGPVDWDLVVISDDADEWDWTQWLPHVHRRAGDPDDDGTSTNRCGRVQGPMMSVDDVAELVDDTTRTTGGIEPMTVIVVDAPTLLTMRTGPLRRRLARGDAACLVLVDTDDSVPSVVDTVLDLGAQARLVWSSSTADGDPTWPPATSITMAGVSHAAASRAALALAPYTDPELADAHGSIPTSLRLGDIDSDGADDLSAVAIARRWQQGGRDPAPSGVVGMSADGVVDIDLVRDGPHALIAGTTGAGKSELLRTLVASLALSVGPDHLNFILVDFKGGSTFDVCARLPHTVGTVTDLDGALAQRVIVSLDAEIRRREELLRAARCDDLDEYRRVESRPLARLVVVVDEFATLAKELPDVLTALVGVAQRGRSLGIHLVLATQRPAGVVTDDIRANTNLRIALRVHDRSDACDVVGDELPSTFPPGLPGRAALRLGPDELVVFQTATTSGPRPAVSSGLRVQRSSGSVASHERAGADRASELVELVEAIGAAAAMSGRAIDHRPWTDPLPSSVRRGDLAAVVGAVGLVDDPDHQTRRVLTWCPADGNVLLVGALGSGTTMAAHCAVTSTLRSFDPDQCHVYVIDGHGDPAWDSIAGAAHCGAVVRIGETERLLRLLRRLDGEMDRRIAGGVRTPTIVVVVESVGSVRGALDDLDVAEPRGRFERVVRDGPGLGVSVCATTDGSSPAALSMPRSATWVFRVDDPSIARSAGLRSPAVAVVVPGRLRVVESGLEAQIALDDDVGADVPVGRGDHGPDPIDVLPTIVEPNDLDDLDDLRPVVAPGGRDQPVELLIGLGADDLRPTSLVVPLGDHVFIGGGARTGRSNALRQIEASWRRTHPEGRVVGVERGGVLSDQIDAALAATSSVLVVVDDADRVDDPDGRLAALVGAHRHGLTVAVAARPETVRVAYGHWVREVARGRCGLIMTSTGDLDGELLGATLPRRSMIPPRPGLAWVIDGRGHHLVQVAARMPPCPAS